MELVPILTIEPKILLAAQQIALDGSTTIKLTPEELSTALELTQQIFCAGCG